MKGHLRSPCILALFLLLTLPGAQPFSRKRIYPTTPKKGTSLDGDTGDPLILTPYIQAGNISQGRKLAQVQNLTNVLSYSGYLTVNPKFNSNIFFWFFPAQFNPETAPVLIWLQGGPGASSLFGLFCENGPFVIDVNLNVGIRNTTWALTHSVLYFDNPVGAGFSFTEDEAGFVKCQKEVARDLYEALGQFYQLFPEFKKRDLFVTGESYAGKYVPAISYKIHTENQKLTSAGSKFSRSNSIINLKGLAIGDGYSDPINMLNYGDYLYGIGLLDSNERDHFDSEQTKIKGYIQDGKFENAWKAMDDLIDGDLSGVPSYFKNATGFEFYFNYLIPTPPKDQSYYQTFLNKDSVRRSIHVGSQPYNDENLKVEAHLMNDMLVSVRPWIETLLDAPQGYKVLIYSGQLDIIVAHTLTEEMLRNMNWAGAPGWSRAPKKIWRVGKQIAGYAKTQGGLTYVIVRDAGHMVPYDQPKWSFDMISRFTAGKPFA